jgi:predicted protein tyrosine phosphatase
MELKAYNTGEWEVKDMAALPPNTVLISIGEEYDEPAKFHFPNDDMVLRVKFSDVRAPIENKGATLHPMSQMDAYNILGFIKLNKDKNFIVHCTAGVSRSGAVALFIHLKYGHQLRKNYWQLSEPNEFVLGKLMIEDRRPTNERNV